MAIKIKRSTLRMKRWASLGLMGGMLLAASACGDNGDGETAGTGDNNNIPANSKPGDNPVGTSDFVSADARSGEQTQGNDRGESDANNNAAAPGAGDGEEERTVEEGDIYRTLSDGRILNLNAYRGLQIININDVSNPQIEGKVRVTGSPVELYVVGQRAFVLMNNWQGYYGSRDDIQVDSYNGGLVMAVDISDPANPRITGQALVPGWIQTSRLTRGNGKEALYVAANDWTSGESRTVVRSFAVSETGAITERTTLDLGGYVADIQATPTRLMVARYDWNRRDGSYSTVSVVDISDEDGFMVEGATIPVEGYIQKKTNMDIHGDVLRVASAGWWGNTNTNHLETFNVADLQNPTRIDHKTFGDNEDLYATLFLGNKAFFVTYRRVDPFHAFEITDEGVATEKSEYIISGWNDWFKPVFGGTRLVGIGVDDAQGSAMAVSLYDIEELENPDPFIAREAIGNSWSWSEARWDDRAFSVLEDAVSVEGPGGVTETGLVLLPFTGWNPEQERYTAAVQIFTFSPETLTLRGIMDHGTEVRRSFRPSDEVTANLSEAEISLFDAQDPDAPAELGRLELAPNYADFFIFGDHGARLKYRNDYWYGWYGNGQDNLPPNRVEIIGLEGDPDAAAALASVEIPADARVYKAGDQLVTVRTRYAENQPNNEEQRWESDIQVYDLSNPAQPREAGSLTTDAIFPDYYGWRGGWAEDCFDCGWGGWWGGYNSGETYEVGDALVFPQRIYESEVVGHAESCWTSPRNQNENPNSYYSGGIHCQSVDGAEPVCTGTIQLCTYEIVSQEGDEGEEREEEYTYSCEEVDPASIRTEESCYDYDLYRYWTRFRLAILDLSNPDAPVVAQTLEMPEGEENTTLKASGDTLYIGYKQPVEVEGDSRSYVRYFFKTLDLSNPSSPRMSAGINVPGDLLAVEGETVFTQDYLWGRNVVDTTVNRLQIRNGRAYLQASHRIEDREIHGVILDGSGHMLISHRVPYSIASQDPNFDWSAQRQELTILNTSDLDEQSHVEVDQWAQLQTAAEGRVLFQVPGGTLVLNFEDATAPYAQAYLPLQGWPQRTVLHEGRLFIPAGRFGLYGFNLNDYNIFLR